MRVDPRWRDLGWRHALWDLIRFYRSLGAKQRTLWLSAIQRDGSMVTGDGKHFQLPAEDVALLLQYLPACNKDTEQTFRAFRTEAEGLAFCKELGVRVTVTKTKMKGHHQSSKCLVAAVTAIAKDICDKRDLTLTSNPQTR